MKTQAAVDALQSFEDQILATKLLTEALGNSDPEAFLEVLHDIAHAHGIARLAQDAGVGRESLYKSLMPGAKPRYDTVLKLLNAMGIRLCAIRNQS